MSTSVGAAFLFSGAVCVSTAAFHTDTQLGRIYSWTHTWLDSQESINTDMATSIAAAFLIISTVAIMVTHLNTDTNTVWGRHWALTLMDYGWWVTNASIAAIAILLVTMCTPHEAHDLGTFHWNVLSSHTGAATTIRATLVSGFAVSIVVTKVDTDPNSVWGNSWAGTRVNFWSICTVTGLTTILITLVTVGTESHAFHIRANVWLFITDAHVTAVV